MKVGSSALAGCREETNFTVEGAHQPFPRYDLGRGDYECLYAVQSQRGRSTWTEFPVAGDTDM